jgi:PAS domain S-box-containing protein
MKKDLLKVLLIEDAPATTNLCIEAFQTAGMSVSIDVCSTKEEFERRIGEAEYDIVLTAYDFTNLKGLDAIDILQRLEKNTPTVVVTGPLGDECAVECMRRGAADYILKEQLYRLPFVVRRAIDENNVRGRIHLLAAAFASQPEGILIAEAAAEAANSKIVFLNAAFTRNTGYTLDDLIGKPLSVFQTTVADDKVFTDWGERLSDVNYVAARMTHSRKDGSVCEAEWLNSPIRDSLGRISHYAVIHRDVTANERRITELKDALSYAETANHAKSDFLVSLSHEIRTPMNVIVGMGDLLSGAQLTPAQAKYIEVFQRAGEDLLVLVNKLLDLSKIESGKFELECIDFDLNEVLTHSTALFEISAHAKGLGLSFRIASEVPTRLVGDPYQLRQILTNLIGNAIKFTEKGSVTVEASLGEIRPTSECSIRFAVVDTGVGIADDKKSLVFENYTQAASSFPRLYGGTGLGLAICRALVEKMKGTILVESTIGVGSAFRFTANFALQPELPKTTAESAPWGVLLCEDSQDNAYLLQAYLEGSDYQIEHVSDGKAGVDRFKKQTFDMVLMDMQMPVLDGYAATRQIRQWEDQQGRIPTPIIAVTAHARNEEIKQCEASGCTAFLSKPIRRATLLAALEKHLPGADTSPDQSALSSEVQRLVPGYVTRKSEDLDRLRMAIGAADYPTIAMLGHQLKGSGTSYGFHEFSVIGNAIEGAAKKRDLQEAGRQAKLLAGAVSEALALTGANSDT